MDSSTKYALLYGGGCSIKDYYMESGNPRQMRGASELLNECVDDVVNELLLRSGVEEKDIITAGATLSAVVPESKGDELAKKAEDIFRQKCRTASAAFVAVPYNGKDYKNVKKRALSAYDRRRDEKFTSWEFQNSEDDECLTKEGDECFAENVELARGYSCQLLERDDKAPRCQRCRLRTIRYRIRHANGEIQYLCASCAKREKKGVYCKGKFRKECARRHKSLNTDEWTSTLSELADSDGRIALIFADVNNLGGQEKETFEADKEFHEKVDAAVKNAVYTAVGQAMEITAGNYRNDDGKYNSKFEVVALGGDDVCILLPGDVALFAAYMIADKFDKASLEGQLGLTISVAAGVANDTTALTYVEDIVYSALKKAKDRAHKIKLEQSEQSVVNMKFFEQKSDLFPMTKEAFKHFIDMLNEASVVAATSLRNIFEARKELKSAEEFELFFNYHLSREVQGARDSKAILENIHNKYKGKNPWPDFVAWRKQKHRRGV